MKRLAIIALSVIALSFSGSGDQIVMICNNGQTKVYHRNANCQGLKRCDHQIVKMSESDAKGKGLRLCGYED